MSGINANGGVSPTQMPQATGGAEPPGRSLAMRLLSMGCSAAAPSMPPHALAAHENTTAHHSPAATFARSAGPQATPETSPSGLSDKTQLDATKQALKLGVSGTLGSLASTVTGLLGHTVLFARSNPEFTRDVAKEMQPTFLSAQDPFDGLGSAGFAEHAGIGPTYELAAESREALGRQYLDGAKHDLVAAAKLTTASSAFKEFLPKAFPGTPALAIQIADKAAPALTGFGWALRAKDAADALRTLETQYALPSSERDTQVVIKAAQSLAVNTVVPIADIATKVGLASSATTPVAVLGVLALTEGVAFYARDPDNIGRLRDEMARPENVCDPFL